MRRRHNVSLAYLFMAVCQLRCSCYTSTASAFAFPSSVSTGRLGCALGAVPSTDFQMVPPEFEPNHPHFFQRQLDLCRRIVTEDATTSYLDGDRIGVLPERHRFVEHPRCTARFGEALLHARDHASSDNEYKIAIYNAQSLVDYVESSLDESNNTLAVRNGLINDIAECLSTSSLYQFRNYNSNVTHQIQILLRAI
ncbi:hypothetical protein QTG54_012705 [Skeletonema marinoi]|uniref:Uncharacterized protein n=1 Tax=Skeletonema marinoi TaxID=267567 RepID=A0AAD8Y036_9STRA|nr:hypothetical protein QTG54_012705 [Skeletonema marinoi]